MSNGSRRLQQLKRYKKRRKPEWRKRGGRLPAGKWVFTGQSSSLTGRNATVPEKVPSPAGTLIYEDLPHSLCKAVNRKC